MKPTVGITLGDFNGIGPEIALRVVTSPRVLAMCTPVLIGPISALQASARLLQRRFEYAAFDRHRTPGAKAPAARGILVVEPAPVDPAAIMPGKLSKDAGAHAVMAIERAVRMTMAGELDAIVTGPISKQAVHLAGISVPGQTELLQQLTGSSQVAMMLVSRAMRVGLVTTHLALQDVARTLTVPLVKERITTIHEALVRDWRIRGPLLAILALNPHAGEGGDLGREELETIIPALRQLTQSGIRLIGPLPADGFFARYDPGDVDAIVAMYHDQGLIPLKMSARGRAVNVSVGLPIVRTSPDHGTGFDIAGKGVADPSSMFEAITLAVTIARNRRRPARRTP